MDANDVRNLAETLLRKTENKEADWQSSSRVNEFTLSLGSGTVTIDSLENDFVPKYEITVFNKRGDNILSSTISPGNPLYSTFEMLHEKAKAHYYKADETIKGLISELSKPGIIGAPPPKAKPENLDEEVPF